jgi:hypothetical protein
MAGRRRRLVALTASAVLSIAATAILPTLPAGAAPSPGVVSHSGRSTMGRLSPAVDLKQTSRTVEHPALTRPILTAKNGKRTVPKTPAAPSQARTLAMGATRPRTSAAGSGAPTVLTAFEGASYEQQIGWAGVDQAAAPPDTHIAVGKNYVVEVLNASLSVWSKSGTLQHTYDLNNLFPVPAGYSVSDPWVLYFGGAYYASALAYDSKNNSQVYVAVSAGEDPTVWYTSLVKTNVGSVFYDQPKLGVSYVNGMTLVWDDFDCSRAYCPFIGEEIWVGYSNVIPGNLYTWSYGPDINRYGSFPAQLADSFTDGQYLVFNASDPNLFTLGPPQLGLEWISGRPGSGGSVSLQTVMIPMVATAMPPDAPQAGGGRPIATNDDRIVSAFLDFSGSVWLAANDACTPAGDTAVRSCLRFIHIDSGQHIDQNFDAAEAGRYLYYPAVTRAAAAPVNGFTNTYTFLVYSRSSATESPSLVANAFLANAPANWLGETVLHGGTGAYDCAFCGVPNRWGDFSSAVVEPGTFQTDVWLAGEYAAAGTDRQNWGTSISRMTVATPQMASVVPNVGTTAGGTTVTITGSGFTNAGTTVKFATTPATGIVVQSPNILTAISPALPAGTVGVTVSSAIGASMSTPPPFQYQDPPIITSISPTSGTAYSNVVITGTNLGPNPSVTFGSVPAQVLSASANQIVVEIKPQLGSVNVTVTTAVATATSPTPFTYQPTMPSVNTVSPNQGSTGGGASVNIWGSGFNDASAVMFGSVPATSFQVSTGNFLTAVSPVGIAGTADVTVVSGPNSSAISASDHFTYVSISVTGINPSSGSASATTPITVTGTGFDTSTGGYTPSIVFDGMPQPFTVMSATQGTATAFSPRHAGPVQPIVCTTVGCSAPGATYTFQITASVTPSTGPTAGGTTVVLNGSGLAGVQHVTFGSVAATFTVQSDSQLTATSPPQLAGQVGIGLALADATKPVTVGQFTYVAARPAITSIRRPRGPTSGGAAATIIGNGFGFTTAVNFGAVASPAFHVDSDTQITAVAPSQATGLVDVSVTTAGGTSLPAVGDHFSYSDCVMPYATDKTLSFGAPCTALSNYQYGLGDSDGTTWEDIDPYNLVLQITPRVDSTYLVGGNADLWTVNAGFNQDLGIDVNGTIVAWKESGGFAGTFSPNAAFVQTVYRMTAGQTYVIRLKWKTNKADPAGVIVAAAGGGTPFSPTRLTATLIPNPSTSLATAVSGSQYRLTGSDGVTWKDIDPSALATSLVAPADGVLVLGANADLWTANAGFNQDLAINVNGSIAGWKESGGFAGTFSPNAAFLQTVYPATAGQRYNIKLQWKTNKSDPGGVILAAAGLPPNFSPTRLTVAFFATGVTNKVINNQYQLSGSDGATWKNIDATNLIAQITTTQNCLALVSGNADLWTANAGFNQDIGLLISGGSYGTGQIVAWKESGGFAGTFSPNAAFVQALVSLPPGSYTASLQWKTNKQDPGTIFAAAGLAPNFSPSSITVQLDSCTP